MAGEVRLDLQVGLDLAFLRNQLNTIGTQLGGQPISIAIKFDRRVLDNQYRLLQRSLGAKKFNVEINTNLKAEIEYANRLATALSRVQQIAQGARGAMPVGMAPFSRTKGQGGFDAGEIKKLYEALAIAGVEGFERGSKKTRPLMVAQIGAVAKDTIAGLVNGINSENPAIQQAAKSLGQTLIKAIKATLGIASPSREFREIGKNVGEGFEQGALSSMDEAFDKLEAKIKQRARILDTIARGVFRMLGMDPVAIREADRQRRLPPAINWPAQVPQRQAPNIGPSSTGRLLTGTPALNRIGPANIAGLLPSSAASILQRDQIKAVIDAIVSKLAVQAQSVDAPGALGPYLGTIQDSFRRLFDDYGKVINAQVREVASSFDIVEDFNARRLQSETRAFNAALAEALQQARREIDAARVRMARVTDLGVTAGLLGPATERPMLPAAGGTGGYFGAGNRPPGGGFVPPGGFPSDGIQGPRSPMGGPRTELGPAYLAGGRFAVSLESSDRFLRQARVPLAGAIQELGLEFGEATKQVLLYGTAYKALAFFMDIPNQALQAATALQTFNNQLLAVTGSSQAADQSFGFVDNLADRFAVPLDSARQGFVRLYASMAPAGFESGQIQGLFEGISKAAATFGMSADKVDRVTYAFSQMASKGQIMAEELRGQLGDVLPGSLALFAEAAQMSIPEFTKAMEDGAFKGKAMEQVLDNVAILLNTKFASGAQGAAKTLQGALNQMSTGMMRLYESFEPIVNQLAATLFPSISEALGSATAAVKAFGAAMQGNTGPANMLSSQGQAIYNVLRQVAEIGQALANVVQRLAPTFTTLGNAVLFTLEQIARFVNTPVGGFLANFAAQVALTTAALQLMVKTGIVNAIAALVRFATQTDATIWKLKLLIKTSVAARLALIAIGSTIVIGAIAAVAEGIDAVVKRTEKLRKAALEAKDAIRSMGETEVAVQKQTLQRDIGFLQTLKSKTALTPQEAARAAALGVELQTRETGPVIPGTRGQRAVTTSVKDAAQLQLQIGRQEDLLKEVRYRERVLSTEAVSPSLQQVNFAADQKDTEKTAKDASSLNALLQREVELQTRLGLIGKDTFSQLEAKHDLSKQILKLTLEDIRATKQGEEQTQLINNAILEYQVTVAELNEEWQKAEKDIENLSKRASDLYDKIINQRSEKGSPLQEAIKGIKEETQDAIETIDELLEGLNKIAGTRPEGGALRATLGNTKAMLQEMTPEQETVLASRQLARPVLTRLKEQKLELEGFGKTFSTIDRIILDFGKDWASLSSVVQNEIIAIAASVDILTEKVNEQRESIQLIEGEVGRATDSYKDFVKEGLTGGNIKDALKQFQQALTDQALTLFLDVAFKPVEEFISSQFKELFGLPDEEKIRKEQLAKQEAIKIAAEQIQKDVSRIANGESAPSAGAPSTAPGAQPGTGGPGSVPSGEEEVNKFKESLQKTVGAIGIAAGSIMGIAAGVSQIKEGGAANVLGGIGSILLGIGGGIGGFANLFKAANGAVWKGGFRAFANGGTVTGPTLGLVGEGRYNEAIVPLPDGRSIPVQMKGQSSSRELLGSSASSSIASPMLSMSFQSTTINGVEYVDRGQLEAAMAETRKLAARDGASRGASLALDRLQNSPSARRKVGIR